jgi:L-alanine-DL-glutamate epimerase-like enolase superfamily enzyme
MFRRFRRGKRVAVAEGMVDELTTRVYRIPTDAPEADGTLSWDATTMVVVLARAGPTTGLGWTYGAAAAASVVDDLLAPVVCGRPAGDPRAAYHRMAAAVRNAGRPGVAATAISAVDVALWDLAARQLGVRLARLLGQVHDSVPVYGSGGFTTYDADQLERQLAGWVHDDGIPRVKIKIGEGWGSRTDRDLDRVRQARRIIGPDAELYVDANGGYSRKQAIRVGRQLAEEQVSWYEEPVSSDDLVGLRQVRAAVTPDVTAGEYGYDLVYFRRMCEASAVDCLQVDVSRCGGVTEWLRAAPVAAAHGLQVSGHCVPHLHLDAALATVNLRHLEWFHDHVRIESMLFDGTVDATGGRMRPDLSMPGHGLTLRDADAERYRTG